MTSPSPPNGPVSSIQYLHDAAFSLPASTPPPLPLLTSPCISTLFPHHSHHSPLASLTFFRLSSIIDSSLHPPPPSSTPSLSPPLCMLRINVELSQPLVASEGGQTSTTPASPPSAIPSPSYVSHIASFNFRVHVSRNKVSAHMSHPPALPLLIAFAGGRCR